MHDDLMNRPDDHEAAMARADLYKLANYSMKLFKMIQEGQELEGWVQAKITKAADYIASVYHYMEYEMKVSEYGETLENSDIYSESVRRAFAQKLTEAKKMAEKAKKSLEKKDLEEAKIEKSGVRADKKKGKVEKSTRKQYFIKLEKEGKTKGITMLADEGESQGEVRDRAARDAKPSGWTVASIRLKDEVDESVSEGKDLPVPMDGATAPPPKGKDGKYPFVVAGPNKGKRWSPQTPGPTNPAMKEAAKPDFLDVDKDGDKKEPMKKALKDKEVKEGSTGDYSAKKARAGKDIGKPGKNFAKIAKSSGKAYGSKERGEKVAGAVLAKLRAKG